MRLIVYVEGVSEETFVKRSLRTHLQTHGWRNVEAIGVATSLDPGGQRGGLTNWPAVEADLRQLFKDHPGADYRFTTLWDFYRTPDRFPGIITARGAPSGTDRGAVVEGALAAHFNEPRFIPYIQMYEFEALVLAALAALKPLYPVHAVALDALSAACQAIGDFETINDGPDTHPAKRIADALPGFLSRKEDDGPIAIRETGLAELRTWCPRFNRWLSQLEGIPNQP